MDKLGERGTHMTTTSGPIIRGVQTVEERTGQDFKKSILPYIPEEIDDFETEATRFLNGEWESEDKFIMYRLVRGVYGQRQADVQMIRVKIPAGALTADQLDAFGEVVSKFAPLKKGHVTTRENIHDLAFIPKVRTGADGQEERGFEFRVGGGTSIMPRIAWTLYDFVSVDEYLRVSEAVIRVFHHTDELRKNKMRARIKFYIDRIGIDAFRLEVDEELRGDWAKADFDPTPLMELPPELQEDPPALVPVSGDHKEPAFLKWRESNVLPQAQEGYNAVFVTLPLGDIMENQFPVLSDIARKYAGGRLRTTAEQNLIYRWVPEGYLYDFWRDLESIGLAEDGANKITDVVACPGTDSCKMGITSSMGVAVALRKTIREFGTDDPLINELHVKVSGCPNGCSRHHIANIGFHGAAAKGDGQYVPAYEIFLAGNYGNKDEVRFGHRVKAKVPAKRVPELMTAILTYYRDDRTDGEKFNDFVDRVGTAPFEEMAGKFREVGKLNKENIGAYMDWGQTILYKLERGEGECAV
jgi:sulfite reductase beta subunit-like hemoprotein